MGRFGIVVGSLWVVVGRCGSLWDRCGSLWIVVDRCGSLWVVVGRCGSFRVLVTTGADERADNGGFDRTQTSPFLPNLSNKFFKSSY